MAQVQLPTRPITLPDNVEVACNPTPTNDVVNAYLEARRGNDTQLIESTYQDCLDHFGDNSTDSAVETKTQPNDNQTECSSIVETESLTAVLGGLRDYFQKLNLLKLTASGAQEALSLLTDMYTRVIANINACATEAGKELRIFVTDLNRIVRADGNSASKAVAVARYIHFKLTPLFNSMMKIVKMGGKLFYYEFWKLEATKMYFRTVVLVGPYYKKLTHGISQVIICLDNLRIRVMKHPMTQDIIWACQSAFSSILKLGTAILDLIPASVLDFVKGMAVQLASGVASQCVYNAFLFLLGKATGNVFANQQQVAEAIGRVAKTLGEMLAKSLGFTTEDGAGSKDKKE